MDVHLYPTRSLEESTKEAAPASSPQGKKEKQQHRHNINNAVMKAISRERPRHVSASR